MKASDIRKAVDEAIARHRKFGAGSAYHVGPEAALEDALTEATGEFRSVGVINGPATVANMTAAARKAWPFIRGGTRPGAGRPAEVADARRVNVTLDPATIERAKEIGAGNVSAGIRAAVAAHPATVR